MGAVFLRFYMLFSPGSFANTVSQVARAPFYFELKCLQMSAGCAHILTTLDHSLYLASCTSPFFREETSRVVGSRHLNWIDAPFRGLETPIFGAHLLSAPVPASKFMLELIP